jgi:hypothetical protein
MLSPTFRSWSVSFEAWNSCVLPSASVTATLPRGLIDPHDLPFHLLGRAGLQLIA